MVKIITELGFCYGVSNAIHVLEKAGSESENIILPHPLLHNRIENDRLLEKALMQPKVNGCIYKTSVVFSAHGHSPEDETRYKGLGIYDGTCPLIVSRYRSIANNSHLQLLFLGKKNHQETKAFLSRFNKMLFIDTAIDFEYQLNNIKFDSKIGLISQTTCSRDKYNMLLSLLESKAEVVFSLGICPVYEKRKNDILEYLSGKDGRLFYLVVAGDTLSSNANELLNVALSSCKGLKGCIAMSASDIHKDDCKGRTFLLASSTSCSKESASRLLRELEALEG